MFEAQWYFRHARKWWFVEKFVDSDESKLSDTDESTNSDFYDQEDDILPDSGDDGDGG